MSVASSTTPASAAAFEQLLAARRDREEPTRTKTARATYQQRLRGRWDAIMAALREGVVDLDAFGLRTEALIDPPQGFDFPSVGDADAEIERQVEAFGRWLRRQVEREILQPYGGPNRFIDRVYRRGVEDARRQLRALAIESQGDVATALRLPVHRQQLQQLYRRNFAALEEMTAATADEMREVLTEGLAGGESPREVARSLRDRVDHVGKHRANLIGRTELMHSHNAARAREWERAGVGQVTILLAPDACPECQALKQGAPYPVDQAEGLLPEHPNCRCALSIYTGS